MKYSKLIAGATLVSVMALSFAFIPTSSATSVGAKSDVKAEVKIDSKLADASKRFMKRVNWHGDMNLKNTINNGLTVKGNASVKKNGSLYDVRLRMQAANFPPTTTAAGVVYEVWLVTDSPAAAPNATPAYQLSLGAMEVNKNNRAFLNFSSRMVNPNGFNRLVITQEIANDTNPLPGTVVFSAELNSF